MRVQPITVVALFASSICLATGCEESTSTSGTSSPNSGGAAQSHLGKSVEMGKDLRNQIQGRDMAAGAMADTITGGDGVFEVGGVAIPIPTQWTKVTPANSMRLAQYEAEQGEVVISISQAGGSADANIDRWAGQVIENNQPAEPFIETFTAGGFDVTYVELTGDYTEGGMMGTPTVYADYTMLGAIIDTGATKTFVKMTGPFSLVDDNQAWFMNMIHGIQQN